MGLNGGTNFLRGSTVVALRASSFDFSLLGMLQNLLESSKRNTVRDGMEAILHVGSIFILNSEGAHGSAGYSIEGYLWVDREQNLCSRKCNYQEYLHSRVLMVSLVIEVCEDADCGGHIYDRIGGEVAVNGSTGGIMGDLLHEWVLNATGHHPGKHMWAVSTSLKNPCKPPPLHHLSKM